MSEKTLNKRAAAIALKLCGFDGVTISEVLSISQCYVSIMCKGVEKPTGPLTERSEIMADLYRGGLTLDAIGRKFDVTRERVRQVLAKQGMTRLSGGVHQRSIAWSMNQQKARDARWDEQTLAFYGCTSALLKELNDGPSRTSKGCAAFRYTHQRKTAQNRGIEWKITFPEWFRIWKESGHWEERGRGRNGYVMARYGDSGPYSPENVEIITANQNASDMHLVPRKKQARKPKDPAHLSPRQQQVMPLMLEGLTATQIAAKLGIKYNVAHGYCAAIKRKMELQRLAA